MYKEELDVARYSQYRLSNGKIVRVYLTDSCFKYVVIDDKTEYILKATNNKREFDKYISDNMAEVLQ